MRGDIINTDITAAAGVITDINPLYKPYKNIAVNNAVNNISILLSIMIS